jgi:hypothetical protein
MKTGEKAMDKVKKYVIIFGIGVIALPGILFLAKVSGLRRLKRMDKGADKSMHEKLRETKMALDKATDLVQRALNQSK